MRCYVRPSLHVSRIRFFVSIHQCALANPFVRHHDFGMKTLSISVLLALTAVLPAADKPARLFILSGQWNMAGMNPKTGFEPETAALFPAADVASIKIAAGGQALRYWVAEWDEIAKKHGIDVANSDPRGAWVDCDDLNDKQINGITINDLHYTPQGYELLGRRYVRQAKALIEKEKPAQNGRPE